MRKLKWILLPVGLFLLVVASVATVNNLSEPPVASVSHDKPSIDELADVTTADTVYALTNAERKKEGLQPLMLDERLNKSALAKCQDMSAKNYYGHDDPDGNPPWKFFKVEYKEAAENLASARGNPVESWMNSKLHKDNILNPRFDRVGFGICDLVVVQHFIDSPVDQPATRGAVTATPGCDWDKALSVGDKYTELEASAYREYSYGMANYNSGIVSDPQYVEEVKKLYNKTVTNGYSIYRSAVIGLGCKPWLSTPTPMI